MRILLVHTNRERAPQPAAPLGLCLVAAALEARGFETRVLDLCFSRRPERDIARAAEWRPDIIGLSVRNLDNGEYLRPRAYLAEAAEIARACRAHSRAPLVIGGPAVSIAPAALLARLDADYAVVGDGEQALPALAAALAEGKPAAGRPGVCSPGSRDVSPARVDDLDSLPRAHAGRWLDFARYARRGSPLPIQTKRGCAFECIYCTYRLIEGSAYRRRSPEAVVEEIAEAKTRWGVRRFEIVDSTFNHPPAHALELCEAIARRNPRVDLHTMGLNPSGASRELLMLMKRAGFRSAVCTPESGSPRMLDSLRKGFTVDEVARTAAWAREAGLSVLWAFLLGGPGESEETVRETVDFMTHALGPRDRIICTLGLRIYPRTELERIARAEGLLAPGADLAEPNFYLSPRISPKRILALLESSPRRLQMLYLETLQRPSIAWALRLQAALGLRGAPWASLPLYNRLTRGTAKRQRTN